jgi:hypothetical protein
MTLPCTTGRGVRSGRKPCSSCACQEGRRPAGNPGGLARAVCCVGRPDQARLVLRRSLWPGRPAEGGRPARDAPVISLSRQEFDCRQMSRPDLLLVDPPRLRRGRILDGYPVSGSGLQSSGGDARVCDESIDIGGAAYSTVEPPAKLPSIRLRQEVRFPSPHGPATKQIYPGFTRSGGIDPPSGDSHDRREAARRAPIV